MEMPHCTQARRSEKTRSSFPSVATSIIPRRVSARFPPNRHTAPYPCAVPPQAGPPPRQSYVFVFIKLYARRFIHRHNLAVDAHAQIPRLRNVLDNILVLSFLSFTNVASTATSLPFSSFIMASVICVGVWRATCFCIPDNAERPAAQTKAGDDRRSP